MKKHGGYVDGIHYLSMARIREVCGCNYLSISRRNSLDFYVKGHRVVLDHFEGEEPTESALDVRAPRDPLAVTLAARSQYKRGVYRGAGLLRRPA